MGYTRLSEMQGKRRTKLEFMPMTTSSATKFPVSHNLVRHAAGADGVAAVMVEVAPVPDGGLRIDYRVDAKLAALRLAVSGATLDPERLWAHTCCELFLARADETIYREYNFSPSGQWAGFSFSAYRERIGADLPVPGVEWRREPQSLYLSAILPAAALPQGRGALTLAPTAVVESTAGELSYWALLHPGERPDFHDRRAFLITLESI